jgi:hypothetical protein
MVVDLKMSLGRSALLFGITPLALPAWDQEMGWNNLTRVRIVRTIGARALAN